MFEFVEMQLGNEKLYIETGKMAKQANGAALVRYGSTVVLVAATAAKEPTKDSDMVPLTVDYRERSYAIGKIPGVYGRREPRPGTNETLISRLVDHCIRPLFPKNYNYEVQVLATAFSSDQEHMPDTLALIGASAALCLSDIPFAGPVAAVVVGRINGQLIVNPTYDELDHSDLELFVSGNSNAVMSVEGGAKEITEDEIIEAIEFAHLKIKGIAKLQEDLLARGARPKRVFVPKAPSEELDAKMRELATGKIRESIGMADKQQRASYLEDLQEDVLSELGPDYVEHEKDAIQILTQIEREQMRQAILNEGRRIDGRGVKDIRLITAEVGVLPRTHGSALFTRGQTQVLCVVTLGTTSDEEVIFDLEGESTKAFMLHYNFPPYSVGEVRRIGGPGRREIGHGALAERAILPAMPAKEEFPYTVRVVSEILESNSSSSMATVCGASLALMDAGVLIKKPVAGVGVGLIKEGDKEVILTDMLGDEDHLGDMDFKVAGTRVGITAVQLDIKIEGISIDLMRQAIHQAKEARMIILDKMDEVISQPRPELSSYAPRLITIKINPDKIRDVIGPGGKMIRKIQAESEATINIEDDGSVEIAAVNIKSLEIATEMVNFLTAEAEVGKSYKGKVTRITNFGAFVEFLPGQEGLVHISELADGYVRKVEDVVKEGDEVTVKVLERDEQGRVELSMRTIPKEDRAKSERPKTERSDQSHRKPPRLPKSRYRY